MKTSVAAEYPVSFGTNYAIAYKAAVLMKEASVDGTPRPSKCDDSGIFDTVVPWEDAAGMPTDLSFLDCADVAVPFVPQGLGAPTGLSVMEHCLWALKQEHPDATKISEMTVDDDLYEATVFEKDHSAQEIDDFRQHRLNELLYLVTQLKPRQEQWRDGIPEVIRQVAGKLHGPLAGVLEQWAEMPDKGKPRVCD